MSKILSALLVLAAAHAACPAAEPVRLIFDTDMESDVDDVGTAALLHALADNGEVKILAMMLSAKNPHSAACLDAINTYYGRPDLPIGNVKGEGVMRHSRYAEGVAGEFPHDLASGDDAPDATALYRRVLSAQPDRSVVVVTVGYLTNLRNLLESGPEPSCRLAGPELVRQKVKLWVCMGGAFPSGKESNLKHDPAASLAAIRDWPTPIVFSGWEIGAKIPTGARLRETPKANPVRRAYELYNGLKHRQSWDQTAVLFAVRGAGDYWDLQTRGHNYVGADGSNQWRAAPDKDHTYLIQKMPPGKLAAEIEELMIRPPRR
jgi:inosine-uridine nucleoside N-ribohydrolase